MGQNLFDFSDNLEKNLGELSSVNETRCNLNLHRVSISGKLIDLKNRPAYLSEMNNNTGYLIKYNNLNDVISRRNARSNLGIKDMALEDADNIGGTDFFPLGTLGFKMDSNECIFDDVYVDEGDLDLKTPDYVSEKNADFLTVMKDNENVKKKQCFSKRFSTIFEGWKLHISSVILQKLHPRGFRTPQETPMTP